MSIKAVTPAVGLVVCLVFSSLRGARATRQSSNIVKITILIAFWAISYKSMNWMATATQGSPRHEMLISIS